MGREKRRDIRRRKMEREKICDMKRRKMEERREEI